MSLAEIFNNGTTHPWANFRINSLVIDDTLDVESIQFNGANQSPLMKYEELTLPVAYSGWWGAPQNQDLHLTKIGNKVTLHISAANAVALAGVTTMTLNTTALLPDRFKPLATGGQIADFSIHYFTNSGLIKNIRDGICNIDLSGLISIYALNGINAGEITGVDNLFISYITSSQD